ncbi:TrbI/VirB10 family protein [Photobacterium indicum]|uniref:TrbI/VirB10 family protein n=1 Tax=Photobacterium indicum TaxID=81447 RepID=UPI003D0D1FDC
MSDEPTADDNTESTIASVHPSRDRNDLNVGGRPQRSKLFILGLGLIGIVALVTGGYWSVQRYYDTTTPPPQSPTKPNLKLNDDSVSKGATVTEKTNDEVGDNGINDIWRKKAEAQAKIAAAKAKAEQERREREEENRRNNANNPPPPTVVARRGNNRNTPPTPTERKLTGSVMVSFDGDNTQQPARMNTYDPTFNAPHFEDGVANIRQPHGLDFLLQHGTSIGCALYTQIISDYQGIVTCRVISDIYSANGAALLIEKGSVITGMQNVAMEIGKARVFTNWADIETPLGVSIRIDSLGAGALGASGSEVWVDDHFSQRFGGAIMLSFVDDALATAANNASKDTSDVSIDNSTSNVSDMASKALDASINIAPTGYSQIGQRINILVARDIDMSSVYQFQ